MSGSYPYPLQEQRYQYLSNVFKTLIVRDIVQRHNVRNESALLRIADYMMDNVSNITSARNITDALNADGLKITNKTVGTYMGYLCDAFAFYKVRRYDIRGKKYLKSGEKYYLADHAFKYALLGTRDMDWGRVYENMVAIELLRRGYEVYVGVLYKKEIDFVAIKRSEKLYIQVSDDISSDKTFEREISPLLSIGDAYPKMILARTHQRVDILRLKSSFLCRNCEQILLGALSKKCVTIRQVRKSYVKEREIYMRTSKKILSFFLAVVMVVTTCSVGFTAFAKSNDNPLWKTTSVDADSAFDTLNKLADQLPSLLMGIEAISKPV